MDSVKCVTKRNCQFFQAIWEATVLSCVELYKKFCTENPTACVSYGTFFARKPFYVRHASKKDLVMCCCILHLHVRWVIQALIKCLDKQSISFAAANYEEFFDLLYADCPSEQHTYISFECTPDKHNVCNHIKSNWENIQGSISAADDNITVLFTQFQKLQCFNAQGQPLIDKKGKPLKRLTPVKSQAITKYLVEFLSDLLPDIIHHRNLLKL